MAAARDSFGEDFRSGNCMKSKLKKLIESEFTPGQLKLAKIFGTPSEFAIACHLMVPEFTSYDEAEKAAQEYRNEFINAK